MRWRSVALALAFLISSAALAVYPNNPESGFPAVGMCGDWNGTNFTQWGSGCAVAPLWVITARHVGGTHFFQNGTYYQVAQKFYHTDVSGNNADLALWKLTTPVPNYMPLSYRPFTGTNGIQGLPVKFVGYGLTLNAGVNQWNFVSNSNGVKRSAVNAADALWPGVFVNFGSYTRTSDYLVYDVDDPSGNNQTNTYGGHALVGEGGISDMDSGCPWFVDDGGTLKITAVSSIIGTVEGSQTNNPYAWGGIGAGTFTPNYITWIQTTVPELGNGPATLADIQAYGSLQSGTVSSLTTVDNTTVRIKSFDQSNTDYYMPVALRVGLTTNLIFPAKMDITVDAKSSVTGSELVYLRNWTTNKLDQVGAFSVSTMTGSRTAANISAVDHVRASDRRIEVYIAHNNYAADVAFTFMDIDRVLVNVKSN